MHRTYSTFVMAAVLAAPSLAGSLHQFPATPADGANPYGGVVFGPNGTLYGTTVAGGGPQNNGVVYALAPPSSPGGRWSESVLWAPQAADGINPYATLAIGPDGTLYGTLFGGGIGGNGAVFAVHPPAAPQVLHRFRGQPDAASPTSGVLLASGILYGTTLEGGRHNAGAIYQVQLPAVAGGKATETVLYSFTGGADGGNPFGGLTAGAGGALFGTTRFGGTAGFGCIFQLTPPATSGAPWSELVLYSFSGSPDAYPIGGVALGTDGALYGATFGIPESSHDFGNVYRLSPPAVAGGAWSYSSLHAFTDKKTDAANPTGVALSANGNVYVTAYAGASAIVQLAPPAWTETLFSQTGPVYAPVTGGPDGALYGAAFGHYGSSTNAGTVFRVPLH